MTRNVKGVLLGPAVDGVRRLLGDQRLRIEELENDLREEDLAYLKTKVVPSMWYPVDVCGRYVDLLFDASGRSPAFTAGCGAFAAHEVLSSRIYAEQMATAKRWGSGQVARAVVHLGAQLYDFMSWWLVGDFDAPAYGLEVRDAAGWPDVLRRCTEGFIHVLHSDVKGRELSVRSSRPSPDRVVFDVVDRG